MEEIIQKILENSSNYQAPAFEFADLLTALFIAPINDPISRIFIFAILYVFLCAIWPRMLFAPIFSKNAVATLPSIGILGTFIGVLVAVSQFDTSPDGMVQSLGVIMQGLKIAFSTSIYGLAGSIIVRFHAKSDVGNEIEVGPEEILDAIRKGNSEAKEGNSNLVNAIAGDSDGSLNNQLRLMRQDLTDFAKTVAEANTTAFIDALKQAIADFNRNLTEQFGENFAKLNDAVGKLLDWQENNKKDMESLRETLDEFVTVTKATSEAIQKIEKATASIPENISGLTGLLEKLDKQVDEIEQRLEAFAEVANKASSALPEIKNILSEYTDDLRTSMAEVLGQVKEIVSSQEAGFDGLANRYDEIASKIENTGVLIEEKFSEAANGISEAAKQANQSVIDTSGQVIEQNRVAAEQYQGFIQQSTDDIKQNLKTAIDTATTEINNATSNASEQLTGIISEATQSASRILQTHSDSVDELKTQLAASVQDFRNDFNTQLVQSLGKQDEALNEYGDKLTKSYDNANNKLQELIQNHFDKMQDAVNKTIEGEMQELSSRLAGISSRIADDYGPLTDRIREIVKLGEQAQNRD